MGQACPNADVHLERGYFPLGWPKSTEVFTGSIKSRMDYVSYSEV